MMKSRSPIPRLLIGKSFTSHPQSNMAVAICFPEDGYHPDDERYTVEYIQREAYILLRFLRKKKHKGVGKPAAPLNDMDHRILRRWGIK